MLSENSWLLFKSESKRWLGLLWGPEAKLAFAALALLGELCALSPSVGKAGDKTTFPLGLAASHLELVHCFLDTLENTGGTHCPGFLCSFLCDQMKGGVRMIYLLPPCFPSPERIWERNDFYDTLLLIDASDFCSSEVSSVSHFTLRNCRAWLRCIYRASREGRPLREDILPANLFAERWAHIFRMMTDQNIWLNVSVSVSFFKAGKFQHVAVKKKKMPCRR